MVASAPILPTRSGLTVYIPRFRRKRYSGLYFPDRAPSAREISLYLLDYQSFVPCIVLLIDSCAHIYPVRQPAANEAVSMTRKTMLIVT